MTPLQTRLCEDMLDLAQLKADLGSAEGQYGRLACWELRVQLEALSSHYAALARAVLEADRISHPFES